MVGQQGGQAYTLKIRSGCAGGGKGALVQTEKTGTLSTLQDQTLFQPVYCLAGNIIDRSETAGANGSGVKENQSYTLNTVDRPAVAYKVFDARGNGDGKTVPTITGDHESRVTDYTAILTASYGVGNGQTNVSASKETSGTLTTMHDPQAVALEYRRERLCAGFAYKAGAKANGIGYEVEKMGTLYAERHDAAVIEKTIQWIVRRLTPTECERLQGYPDGWTDIGEWTDTKGKKHKAADSPRYKALGNSIALPQWFWIAQKMKQYLPAGATLGSLFDGIGGFPLVWETTYGKGTARWASEIEEFPIAVTKRRFGNDSENKGDSGTVLCGGNCQCHKSCGDAETH
jgi:DNA (cytosine-5)-methyltransferase 1